MARDITVNDLIDFEQEVVLASDTREHKRLTATVYFDNGKLKTRMEVRDTSRPKDNQIVLITDRLETALTRYNEIY